MAFKPTPRGYRTMMGVSPAQAAATLLEAGADVVGANCEITGEEMPGLVAEFREATDAPLVIQPNAGQPTSSGATPSTGDARELRFVHAGHRGGRRDMVGGCCGTTPAHIAALAQASRLNRGLIREPAGAPPVGRPGGYTLKAAPTASKMSRTACSAVISMGS